MIKTLLLAAGISFVAVSTASAVTAPAKPQTPSSDFTQVKKRWGGDHRKWNKKRWRRGHYSYHSHRYHRPPPGWRSYNARPWGWRRRGCLSIGPVWYCP